MNLEELFEAMGEAGNGLPWVALTGDDGCFVLRQMDVRGADSLGLSASRICDSPEEAVRAYFQDEG